VSQVRIIGGDNFGLWPQSVRTRDDFVVRAAEKLSAFVELDRRFESLDSDWPKKLEPHWRSEFWRKLKSESRTIFTLIGRNPVHRKTER